LPKKQRVDHSAVKRFAGYLPPMDEPLRRKIDVNLWQATR
jgi:hypothetical protein